MDRRNHPPLPSDSVSAASGLLSADFAPNELAAPVGAEVCSAALAFDLRSCRDFLDAWLARSRCARGRSDAYGGCAATRRSRPDAAGSGDASYDTDGEHGQKDDGAPHAVDATPSASSNSA
jgi:hypothetical protein